MISQSEFSKLQPLYPALGEVAPTLKQSLLRDSVRLDLRAGTIMFGVGSQCSYYPLLASGSIKVTKSGGK